MKMRRGLISSLVGLLSFALANEALAASQAVTLYDKSNKVIELLNPLPVTASGGASLGPVAPGAPTATASQIMGCQYVAAGVTLTNLQQAACSFSSAGSLLSSIPLLEQTQGSTTAGQVGTLMQAAVLTNAPTYTTLQTSPLTQSTFGALRIQPYVTGNVAISPGTGINSLGMRMAYSSDSGIIIGTTSNATSITPVVSASAEATHVLKASAGNLYGVYATNLTSTAGFLVVLNSTSAPGDGAITPLECVLLPASGTAAINFSPGPPDAFSTGITAVVTSATTCFTKTTGVITAFIHGNVQ